MPIPTRTERIKALTKLEECDHAIGAQWRRRIERARYEADLAERRYEAVDPHNRLVASTLEQRWNDAAQRVLELETEFTNFERQTLRSITAEQKRQILQLAGNFPRLWTAPTTEARDRKRMLRLLIKDITVVKGPEKLLQLQIRWQGGATEVVELQLPPSRADALRILRPSLIKFGIWRTSMTTVTLPLCSIETASRAQPASRLLPP